MTDRKYSDRLLVLLYFSKNSYNLSSEEDDLVAMITSSLADYYSPNLSKSDVFHHVLEAVLEARQEPKFQLNNKELSSFVRSLTINIMRSEQIYRGSTAITFIDLYNLQLRTMLDMLMLSNIGWCKEYLDYAYIKLKEI